RRRQTCVNRARQTTSPVSQEPSIGVRPPEQQQTEFHEKYSVRFARRRRAFRRLWLQSRSFQRPPCSRSGADSRRILTAPTTLINYSSRRHEFVRLLWRAMIP